MPAAKARKARALAGKVVARPNRQKSVKRKKSTGIVAARSVAAQGDPATMSIRPKFKKQPVNGLRGSMRNPMSPSDALARYFKYDAKSGNYTRK